MGTTVYETTTGTGVKVCAYRDDDHNGYPKWRVVLPGVSSRNFSLSMALGDTLSLWRSFGSPREGRWTGSETVKVSPEAFADLDVRERDREDDRAFRRDLILERLRAH